MSTIYIPFSMATPKGEGIRKGRNKEISNLEVKSPKLGTWWQDLLEDGLVQVPSIMSPQVLIISSRSELSNINYPFSETNNWFIILVTLSHSNTKNHLNLRLFPPPRFHSRQVVWRHLFFAHSPQNQQKVAEPVPEEETRIWSKSGQGRGRCCQSILIVL